MGSFNLLVEILKVQASYVAPGWTDRELFQSLSRDSEGSSSGTMVSGMCPRTFQSISRDSEGSSLDAISREIAEEEVRFNLLVEILKVQAKLGQVNDALLKGFNLLVEILKVQAWKDWIATGQIEWQFQSLSRDSEGSSRTGL